jgi:hypothetical protein
MSHYLISAATSDELLFSGLFSDGVQEAIMYNPETDEWRQTSNPHFGSFYSGAIATTGVYVPQKIYLLASTTVDAAGNQRNDAYDPASNTWSTIKAMSIPREGFGVTVVDDLLYVTGGYIHYRNEITVVFGISLCC